MSLQVLFIAAGLRTNFLVARAAAALNEPGGCLVFMVLERSPGEMALNRLYRDTIYCFLSYRILMLDFLRPP